MHTRAITIAIALFLLIVAGMFLFAYLKKNEIQTVKPTPAETQTTTTLGPYDYIDRVDAKHFYIDGVHTLAGELIMPTPCDLLTATSSADLAHPNVVTVDFDVINQSDTCAQVRTSQRFKVAFTASSSVHMQAYFKGRPITLNLIPAAEGESPDDFELYIKG